MRHGIIVAVVGAVVLAASARGEEQLVNLGVDYTYASRYVTHGLNIGDTPVHQPSLSVSSGSLPGLNFLFWTSLPVDRAKKATDELDLMLIYGRTCMQDDPWAVALSAYFDYWRYPGTSVTTNRNDSPIAAPSNLQGQKYHVGGALPNLVPMPEGFSLAPGYNYYYWAPVVDEQFDSGSAHEIVLNCGVPLPLPEVAAVPQSVNLKGTVNYHTGFLGIARGWTHATAHISTAAPIWESLSWHAGLDYQWTFEETLNGNGDDILWGTLGVGASF